MIAIETIRDSLLSPSFICGEPQIWHKFSYLWVDYQYSATNTIVARYLLLPVSAKEWGDFHANYERFVSDVIEPAYYALRNDLRWNLYLIVVLDDGEYQKVDYHTRYLFESNIEYTRNIIIKSSMLNDRLPINRESQTFVSKDPVYPIDDWCSALGEYYFCLKPFSEENLKNLRCMNSDSSWQTPSAKAVCVEQIQSIKELHIGREFRRHLYQRTLEIPCKTVNLLAGTNGSGKTSVLSAIELAMTGSVLKPKPDVPDEANQAQISICLVTDNRDIAAYVPTSLEEKKDRESRWYNHTEAGVPERLNTLFHRFNYFAVDNAYHFISNSHNISDIFSQTVLGAEPLDMWGNIEEYRTHCKALVDKYSQWITMYKSQLEELPSVEEAHEKELHDYLKLVGFEIKAGVSLKEIKAIFSKVQIELAKVARYEPFDTRSEIKKKLEDIEGQLLSLQRQGNTAGLSMEQKEIERELVKAQQKVEQAQALQDALVLSRPEEKLLMMTNIYPAELLEIRLLREQIRRAESEMERFNTYEEKFGVFLSYTAQPDVQALNDELIRLSREEDSLTRRHNRLLDQYAEVSYDSKNERSLADQLLLASRYLPNKVYECPLCGSKNIEVSDISRHLQKIHNTAYPLADLNRKLKEIEDELRQVKRRIERVQQKIKYAEDYGLAYQTALEYFPDMIKDSELATIQAILIERRRRVNDIKKSRTKLDVLEDKIIRHSNQTIKKNEIVKILLTEERVRKILWENNALDLSTEDGANLYRAFHDALRQAKATYQTYKRRTSELRAKQNKIEKICEQEKERELKLQRDKETLFGLAQFWDNIYNIVPLKVDVDSATLQIYCQEIEDKIRQIDEYGNYQQQRSKIYVSIESAQKKLESYQLLLDRLYKLASPSEYSNRFIKENIKQISRIFTNLHSPQEFSRLEIDENGELYGVREEKKVLITNMSAGQRTAIVLSIFFQIHLSNTAVPRFLLIDEPVLHIDDLNVLSLMDYLRELVIVYKRQIFLTTANHNIAQLFRRKFSFMESEFQKLEFQRENNSDLKIIQRTYDQEQMMPAVNLYC